MTEINVYAACQDGVILDVYSTKDEALSRIKEEINRDFVSIITRRALRRIFKKTGNIALHRYNILHIVSSEEIKS